MKTLLLVDDDDTFRQVLARSMSRHGFVVLQAGSLDSALLCAREHTLHAALIDLRLPGESGLFVVQQLKQLQPTCHVVVLTGFASIATAVQSVKLGAADYLTKPAGTATILHALENPNRGGLVPPPDEPLSVDRLEWEHINKVLHEHAGNISATARALKMHRRTLQRKLAKKPAA